MKKGARVRYKPALVELDKAEPDRGGTHRGGSRVLPDKALWVGTIVWVDKHSDGVTVRWDHRKTTSRTSAEYLDEIEDEKAPAP